MHVSNCKLCIMEIADKFLCKIFSRYERPAILHFLFANKALSGAELRTRSEQGRKGEQSAVI